MWRMLCLILLTLSWCAPTHAEQDYLAPEQAFQFSVDKLSDNEVRLMWKISEGYYLYRQQMKVVADPPASARVVNWPASTLKTDETFGKSEVYHGAIEVQVDAADARTLTITWQGCADAGLCYPPQTQRITVAKIPVVADIAHAASASAEDQEVPADRGLAQDQQLAERLERLNLGWMLLVFFGLGLLMTFTPCVLPMVPILSSLIAGGAVGARRGFMLSLAFVLPMALVYAALGAGAALVGGNLQAQLQNPWMLGAFGLIFVALALSMFGFYELQLPALLRNRLNRASVGQRGGTLTGAAAMGALSAVLVGPCMTAPLAGALLYISNTGDALTGALVLCAMGLGMGAPLLLVGTLGARLLPRPGEWMNRVKALFGFVLLGTAILMVARNLPAAVTLGLWGAWLLAIALSLLALHSMLPGGRASWLSRYLALLIGLWGGAMVIGAAAGGSSALQPLSFAKQSNAAQGALTVANNSFMSRFASLNSQQDLAGRVAQAGQRGQWTLVDFYADWCVSCHVIEREVFGDPRVQQALGNVQLLRPDVTNNTEADRELMRAHQILGPPTMLLIGPDGQEHRALRVIGEIDAGTFLERLNKMENEMDKKIK